MNSDKCFGQGLLRGCACISSSSELESARQHMGVVMLMLVHMGVVMLMLLHTVPYGICNKSIVVYKDASLSLSQVGSDRNMCLLWTSGVVMTIYTCCQCYRCGASKVMMPVLVAI